MGWEGRGQGLTIQACRNSSAECAVTVLARMPATMSVQDSLIHPGVGNHDICLYCKQLYSQFTYTSS
eukprot:5525493-Karenia_brevis.AAC.1